MMNQQPESHWRRLEQIYLSAKIQTLFPDTKIKVSHEHCVITLPVAEQYFHAANAVHGSVYFRLMDDAAWFAVASVCDHFPLTAKFETELLRPVVAGMFRAEGKIESVSNGRFVGSSELFNDDILVARGTGHFALSKMSWDKLNLDN
jgi:uncharacterized protein (TIGR00369 family)